MKKVTWILPAIAAVVIWQSCKKEVADTRLEQPVLPQTSYEYVNVNTANGESINLNEFSFNNFAITNESATLGRVLFYDNKLSKYNNVSCGSCHFQNLAFSDGRQFSVGFGSHKTKRNSMAIINPIRESVYFWDGRVNGLNNQVLMPVANHVEMGISTTSELIQKIKEQPYYSNLFRAAFGSDEITKENIQIALTHFLQSMVSLNSKFDVGSKNNFVNFNPIEKRGKEVFEESGCVNCHGGEDFKGWNGNTANIGLDEHYTDKGVGSINGNTLSEGMFKVPSLRNIALTAPYMHDGRFKTLAEVIDHYDQGIKPHKNLDYNLRHVDGDNPFFLSEDGIIIMDGEVIPKRLNLSLADKRALEAFLLTLTDAELTTHPRFSDPFVNK